MGENEVVVSFPGFRFAITSKVETKPRQGYCGRKSRPKFVLSGPCEI